MLRGSRMFRGLSLCDGPAVRPGLLGDNEPVYRSWGSALPFDMPFRACLHSHHI
jgi:hypothetical protein